MKTPLTISLRRIALCLACSLLLAATASAQHLTQTVRGTVTDRVSGEPLIGAMVLIESTDPVLGAATDMDGNFRIVNVPVGKHELRVKYTGYKDLPLPNLTIGSGKEVILQLQMEEDIAQMQAVEIVAEQDKQEAINAMTTVSARTFSVEETQKFAAAVNDPGRMAQSYAGVVAPDDGGNRISIRGNSPNGLLWRMEGIDIPNPNHYADPSTSGGGISILSAQTLSNSDFLTGAFAAEYGNALGGVFDLRLRKGNNEKREYTIQAGFLGLDLAAEGPIGTPGKGSYLVNYRYSTLSLLADLGVKVGDGVTAFQDLSFNIYLPTERAGSFQLFGFGGLSNQRNEAVRDTSEWEYSWQRYDSRFFSNTGAGGLKHLYRFSENTYLQTTAMMSIVDIGYEQEKLSDSFVGTLDYKELFRNEKAALNTVLNHKVNARHSLRTGVYVNRFSYGMFKEILENGSMQNELDDNGSTTTVQAFGQWKYRVSNDLTLNGGVHVLHLPMNGSLSVEPRLAARYQLDGRQSLSAGYGLHSQMQPLAIYKSKYAGSGEMPNEGLGLNKAHHFVVGYERSLTDYLYVKGEAYYQHLYNIAVSADPTSAYSTLNHLGQFDTERLVNEGRGRNYGLELTVEQFTHKDLYFLLSASLYESEYQSLEGKWRNTRFNGNYSTSFTAGKEWSVGKEEKHRTLGANVRIIYAGGLRETPVDFEASMQDGQTRRDETRAFETKNPDYFRADVRFSLRRNRPNATTTLALDLQNATNHKNVYGTWFDPESGEVRTAYQVPLIPVLSYKVEF